VLQRVAVCCSVLQCGVVWRSVVHSEDTTVLMTGAVQDVAVCCRCCSVLRCVAVCRNAVDIACSKLCKKLMFENLIAQHMHVRNIQFVSIT